MFNIPSESFRVNCGLAEIGRASEAEDRKLYLYGEILSIDSCEDEFSQYISPVSMLVKQIINYNREDKDIPPNERKPVYLYINSPGGELTEGFPLVSAIELSKTPIYTINIGEWCSMAFLIGITGHKRFSLPYMTFLMHEPSGATIGKISDMESKLDFDRKFNDRIIREHVLRHSKMTPHEYDLVCKKEFYMLADDALQYGFVDEIITNIDTIL